MPGHFDIDVNVPVETLANAPIVEAVIHFHCSAPATFDKDDVVQRLKSVSFEVGVIELRRQVRMEYGGGESKRPKEARIVDQLFGLQFRSKDNRTVIQFRRDGMSYSHLKPYQSWAELEAGALLAWRVFRNLVQPPDIPKIGVRFINRVAVKSPSEVSEYLTDPPKSPPGIDIPVLDFVTQRVFEIPGHPFRVVLLQALQSDAAEGFGIVVDIDVECQQATSADDDAAIKGTLGKMRAIKNKLFFGAFTADAIETFR